MGYCVLATGMPAGDAISDILFGKVNPSARLPVTFPNSENEQQFSQAQWPGLPDPEAPLYANYTEGLFVGYRYYDAHGITPKFTFGAPLVLFRQGSPACPAAVP